MSSCDIQFWVSKAMNTAYTPCTVVNLKIAADQLHLVGATLLISLLLYLPYVKYNNSSSYKEPEIRVVINVMQLLVSHIIMLNGVHKSDWESKGGLMQLVQSCLENGVLTMFNQNRSHKAVNHTGYASKKYCQQQLH